MPSNTPDYDLEETIELTTTEQVRAISDPLRNTILSLLHERAATVGELAAAVERPRSTVAHHVSVLTKADLLRVVRTRKVRAIDERYYGRTARMFYVGLGHQKAGGPLPPDFNDFETAAKESAPAHGLGQLRQFIRRARISEDQAAEFWERIEQVVQEFDRLPRSGGTVHGFAVGVYPIPDHPVLPLPPEGDGAS